MRGIRAEVHSSEIPAEKIYETDQATCGASCRLRLSGGFPGAERDWVRLQKADSLGAGGGLRSDKHTVACFSFSPLTGTC